MRSDVERLGSIEIGDVQRAIVVSGRRLPKQHSWMMKHRRTLSADYSAWRQRCFERDHQDFFPGFFQDFSKDWRNSDSSVAIRVSGVLSFLENGMDQASSKDGRDFP